MSTESLFKNILHSSTLSPNVSDAEELELLKKFQNLEERSRLKYKKKLDKAKKRIAELEKKVSEYEAQLANINKNKNEKLSQDDSQNEYTEEEEEEISDIQNNLNQSPKNMRRLCRSNFRSKININKSDMAKAQYITYLENFADVKCDEVECLLNRLLCMQRKRQAKIENNHMFIELQRRCDSLSAENEQLKENFSRAKILIEKFAISHRVSKAERRTRELQELASLRAEYESKNLDLYSFISTQFRQFVDIDNNSLNEKTIKAIVMKAAEMLKKQIE